MEKNTQQEEKRSPAPRKTLLYIAATIYFTNPAEMNTINDETNRNQPKVKIQVKIGSARDFNS